jgi:hypothetical protein
VELIPYYKVFEYDLAEVDTIDNNNGHREEVFEKR